MTLITLFDSQERASQAIQALSADPFSSTDIQVIESTQDARLAIPGAPALAPHSAVLGPQNAPPAAAPVPPKPDRLARLSLSKDEETYLTHGLRSGGVVLVVNPADAPVSEVQHILQRSGGKVLQRG